MGWWFVFGCGAAFVALAAWAGSGAFDGGYPWKQERAFVTVIAAWAGVLFLRTRWDAKPAMPGVVAFGVRWFNHLLTLTLLYVPGLAVLWYSLAQKDQQSEKFARAGRLCDRGGAVLRLRAARPGAVGHHPAGLRGVCHMGLHLEVVHQSGTQEPAGEAGVRHRGQRAPGRNG